MEALGIAGGGGVAGDALGQRPQLGGDVPRRRTPASPPESGHSLRRPRHAKCDIAPLHAGKGMGIAWWRAAGRTCRRSVKSKAAIMPPAGEPRPPLGPDYGAAQINTSTLAISFVKSVPARPDRRRDVVIATVEFDPYPYGKAPDLHRESRSRRTIKM
jgi:hypothetical protein